MTITPSVRIVDRRLIVKNRTILTGVPDNVIGISASSFGAVDGIFVGVDFSESRSRHLVSLGKLRGVRFLACFRFKLWWMAQRMGDLGRDIPLETQFLLLESKSGSDLEDDDTNEIHETVYVVFLPLIEGPFRACLQGKENDEVELCLESGDDETKAMSFTQSVLVSAGSDPFNTIHDAITAVRFKLNTFRLREEKKLPEIVDLFGWCTWDAFYQHVTQQGVQEGIESLTAGGVPPKFVIIDDGWQSVEEDVKGSVMRLTGIKENSKFRNEDGGIKNIVSIAKERLGLRHVYVWHAITGYWGGIRPEQYGSVVKYPAVSTGVMGNEPGWKTDAMAVYGLGLADPKRVHEFYDELHGYLSSAGVDGVKVDVQCILETLAAGLGGRVELTRKYHHALDTSIAKNFPDNGCIACMSHNIDSLYCSNQTGVVRASDDFYPQDPVSHTIHIASVAYNSLFLGEFMQPDWDMFHSLHPTAEYHASARAISGGPVYVSDAPGKHDFELLRKLVLPDGSVLRARLPGRPTHDCLFFDPTRDGTSLLKIWNMNKFNGVLGVYNCQGATSKHAITTTIRGNDVHLIREATMDIDWNGECAIYRYKTREVVVLPQDKPLAITLEVLDYDIFIITPITNLIPRFGFAPFGLIDMFNSGGAIEGLKYELQSDAKGLVTIEVKGCGLLGAYSSVRPRKCTADGELVELIYEPLTGLTTVYLEKMPDVGRRILVVFEL